MYAYKCCVYNYIRDNHTMCTLIDILESEVDNFLELRKFKHYSKPIHIIKYGST